MNNPQEWKCKKCGAGGSILTQGKQVSECCYETLEQHHFFSPDCETTLSEIVLINAPKVTETTTKVVSDKEKLSEQLEFAERHTE